jgi:hypothetical protein
MKQYGWDIKKSFDVLYGSETFKKLCDPQCGLYYESPVYVYTYLEKELSTGRF